VTVRPLDPAVIATGRSADRPTTYHGDPTEEDE
jgi:hypothetical protein